MWRCLLAACLAAVALSSVQPAHAADPIAAFSFVETSVTATCADLALGDAVSLTNVTAMAQTLQLAVRPGIVGSGLNTACGGLSFEGAPAIVAPGDTVTVTLRSANARDVAAESDGAIVAYADSGLAAMIPLAITPETSAGAATPLVSTASATKYRHTSGTPIWIPVDLHAKQEAAFTKGDVVGAVVGAGHVAPVTYVETRKIGAIHEVGLAVSGLPPGSYSGTVNLLPTVPAKGVVTLTLTVKDWWPFVLGALLLSFGLSFVFQHASGVVGPRRKLEAAAVAVTGTYDDARANLEKAPTEGAWKHSTVTDLPERIADMEKEIADETAGAWMSIAAQVMTKLSTDVQALDDSVGQLSQLAIKAAALDLVLRTYDSADEGPLPELLDIELKEPALISAARAELEKQKNMKLADLPGALAEMAAAAKNVTTIQQRRAYVTFLDREISSLEHHLGSDSGALDAQRKALTATWRQVFTTTDGSYLDQLLSELHAVDNALALLWPDGVARPPAATEFYDLQVRPRELIGAPVPVQAPESVALAQDVATARRDVATARMIDAFAVAVGVVLAVVSAMGTLYIGKPFGTFWDYLVLVTWGLASPTALSVAGAALDSLGALGALDRRLARPSS